MYDLGIAFLMWDHEIPAIMHTILKNRHLIVSHKFISKQSIEADQHNQQMAAICDSFDRCEDDQKILKKMKKVKKGKYAMHYYQYILQNSKDQEPTALLLIFFPEVNVTIAEILNAMKTSTVAKYTPQGIVAGCLDIIVLLSTLTPPALRLLTEMVNDHNKKRLNHISLIFRHQIAWDKSKSHYCQHYERMPEDFAKTFLKEHMYNEIPKMYTKDQMVIQHGFKVGDVVHALESDTYRLVVIDTDRFSMDEVPAESTTTE
jgi:DNA-directed RNA polymerase subunit H (RpoH/RPB5)